MILTGAGGEFIPSIDFASFGNVADPDRFNLRYMLILAGIGVGLFLVGWKLQQVSRPK